MRRIILGFILTLTLLQAKTQQRISIVGGVHQSSVSPYWELQHGASSNVMQKKSGFHLGLIVDIPVGSYSNFYFQPGIIYATKGAKQQQSFDTSLTKVSFYTNNQSINYIDLPLNIVYKFPSSSNTRFILGGGPTASFFYTGNTSVSSIDTLGNLTLEINRDLPVGKADDQFRLFHWGFNLVGGIEFGKAFLTGNFSKSITPYFQQGKQLNKLATIGITLGVFINEPKAHRPKVVDGVYECPVWW